MSSIALLHVKLGVCTLSKSISRALGTAQEGLCAGNNLRLGAGTLDAFKDWVLTCTTEQDAFVGQPILTLPQRYLSRRSRCHHVCYDCIRLIQLCGPGSNFLSLTNVGIPTTRLPTLRKEMKLGNTACRGPLARCIWDDSRSMEAAVMVYFSLCARVPHLLHTPTHKLSRDHP